MVAAYSNKDISHESYINNLIEKYYIGGLIFYQGSPYEQASLTNKFQAISKIPLLISIDAEWGLAMRLDSTMAFPKQMTLGAIQNNELIYQMGEQIGKQCKRLGIHMNMAPVLDINNNPNNPVINHRSFGENPKNVANKSLMYMKGMQDQNILANAKHFPGHGDTDNDSHKTLPVIYHDKKRLDSVELHPFKLLIDSGLKAMMVAHLYVPTLDDTPNKPSTLSKKVVTDLLQNELKFKGLIFTDGLNMRGVSAFYEKGKLDVQALIAGNDILLIPEDIPTAVAEIKKAIENSELTIKEIDEKVKKILLAKSWLELSNENQINKKNIVTELNSYQAQQLNHELYKNALTVVKNNNLIPITRLDTLKIATVDIGKSNSNAFRKSINRYCVSNEYSIPHKATAGQLNSLIENLKNHNLIILNVYEMNQNSYQNFGLSKIVDELCMSINPESKIILNVFGTSKLGRGRSASLKSHSCDIMMIDGNNRIFGVKFGQETTAFLDVLRRCHE